MHRRTFLQSLCVLAAAAAIGHTHAAAPSWAPDGWTSAPVHVLNIGDVFVISGTYGDYRGDRLLLPPPTQQFVVTAIIEGGGWNVRPIK